MKYCPLVILAAAALVMLGRVEPLDTRRLVLGSAVAGLSIWAKPQSGPVAVALVAACVLMSYVEQHRDEEAVRLRRAALSFVRSGLLALAAFVAPTILFVLVMWVGGTFDDFAREALAAMWNYTAHRDDSQGIAAPPLGERLKGVLLFAKSFPMAIAWTFGAVAYLFLLVRPRTWLVRVLGLVSVLLPGVASLACLLPIYPLFPHYANFLYVGCLLTSLVAVRLAIPGREDRAWVRWLDPVLLVVSLYLVWPVTHDLVPDRAKGVAEQAGSALSGNGFDFGNTIPRDASPLAEQCPPGKRVLVWGWASELYAYYDWDPASRYVNSTWMLYPSANRATYDATLLQELDSDPPDCIVEALGGAFFAGIDPSGTLEAVVPGASELLDECYLAPFASTMFDGRPVTVYGRNATCGTAE